LLYKYAAIGKKFSQRDGCHTEVTSAVQLPQFKLLATHGNLLSRSRIQIAVAIEARTIKLVHAPNSRAGDQQSYSILAMIQSAFRIASSTALPSTTAWRRNLGHFQPTARAPVNRPCAVP
jgi:hypothetical protein